MYHTRTVLKFKINYFFYSFTFFLKKIQQLCIIYPNAHALFSDSLSDSAKSLYVSTYLFFHFPNIPKQLKSPRRDFENILYYIFLFLFCSNLQLYKHTCNIKYTHTHTHTTSYFFFSFTQQHHIYTYIYIIILLSNARKYILRLPQM